MKLFSRKFFNDFIPFAFPVLLFFLSSGCQKIINVELNNAAEQIVIEGLITNRPAPILFLSVNQAVILISLFYHMFQTRW